ncbi:MAG: aldo/keto reductase [Gemmatimonadetes bacterium]|nr:aldo/keto reductase [Gemmatimonadota bacterium]
MRYSRREVIRLGVTTGAALLVGRDARAASSLLQQSQLMRAIPSTGERIPAVGLGTANTFMDAARTPAQDAAIREVVRRFTELGGRVIDTCPCYGQSERVLGELARDIGNVNQILWVTKISGANGREQGLAQMARSEERLAPGKIFLNQVHNLGNWQVQFPLLRELKQAGRIRYVGITTTSENRYDEVAQILRTQQLDFVQLDYAIDNRQAEEQLFPIAHDRGIATIAALPFGRARLFRRVAGRQLPEWAREIDAQSWAQFFLKYLLSHPDMTVVIPGTSNPDNLVDNMGAGVGRFPDTAMRRRMAQLIDDLPT